MKYKGSILNKYGVTLSDAMWDLMLLLRRFPGMKRSVIKEIGMNEYELTNTQIKGAMSSLQKAGLIYVKMLRPPVYNLTHLGREVIQTGFEFTGDFSEVNHYLSEAKQKKESKRKRSLPPPPPRKKKGKPRIYSPIKKKIPEGQEYHSTKDNTLTFIDQEGMPHFYDKNEIENPEKYI